MRLFEVEGYNKEDAFNGIDTNMDFDKLRNATTAWRKAGAPIETKRLKKFFEDYIGEKRLYGAYIIVESNKKDSREKPYTVHKVFTKKKKVFRYVYTVKPAVLKVKDKQIINDEGEEEEVREFTVVSTGVPEAQAYTKSGAITFMKDLISENHKDYVIEIEKKVVKGDKYAAFGIYTPSKTAKKGKFIFALEDL